MLFWKLVGVVAVLGALAGCVDDAAAGANRVLLREATSTTTTTTSTTTTTTTTSTTTTSTPTPPTTLPIDHVYFDTRYAPYAHVEGVVLYHPASRVEFIGFHESSADGALSQMQLDSAVRNFVMSSRGRGTQAAGAADIVVHPADEIRAPVSGTVVRGGSYTLYCSNQDDFVVIAPDGRPDLEVKLLHFVSLGLPAGTRVEGGVTVIGTNARVLPFASQVDEISDEPSWPHVHLEVVDPTIPDRPGSGC